MSDSACVRHDSRALVSQCRMAVSRKHDLTARGQDEIRLGETEVAYMSDTIESQTSVLGATPDRMARWGGLLLLATAVVTVVMVYARVASDTDQATLTESLLAVAENRGMYGLFGAARLVSGLTLLAAGWFLLRTWIIRDRWATPWVPYLFAVSGVCTAVSGVCVLLIAIQTDATSASMSGAVGVGVVDSLRWIVGKAGFTAAGLALVVAAWFQWRVGGTLRKVAPVSAALGIAMQVIWLPAPPIVHPVVGGLFFLWLLIIGAMLATGRVEQHFVARYSDDARTTGLETASAE